MLYSLDFLSVTDLVTLRDNYEKQKFDVFVKYGEDIAELEGKIDTINKMLGEVSIPKTLTPNDYNDKGNWIDKCKYVIRKAGKPLTTKEVVGEILKIDTTRKITKRGKKIMSSVSPTLNDNAKKGINFVRHENLLGENTFSVKE